VYLETFSATKWTMGRTAARGRSSGAIDPDAFFRECTLRICSSLEAQTFLWRSFCAIRSHIPADGIILTHHDSEQGCLMVLAQATARGGTLLDLALPMPQELRSFVDRPDASTVIVDRAERYPTARPWIDSGQMGAQASLLVMRLVLEGRVVGAVTLYAEQSGRFTEEHAALVSLLREPFAIALSNCIRFGQVLKLKEQLADDNRFLQKELMVSGEEVIGADFGLQQVMAMVSQVAPLASPVLLLGETGTGKEVIATAIHNLSPRRQGPFIKVNCGAIPKGLMDSELFGHEKGAFTGALGRKRGRFERAHGGTIFLDEIGEMEPEVQVRLLRVLQEREIERVGGSEAVPVDIRVIAATHCDLMAMIGSGAFREDLYYRLQVFPIVIPPLRLRKGDIPQLVQHFVRRKVRELGLSRIPPLAPGALERLVAYSWPGNVRELQNAVERALILARGAPLTFAELSSPGPPEATSAASRLRDDGPAAPSRLPAVASGATDDNLPWPEGDPLELDEVVSRHIQRALSVAGGRVSGPRGAARLLGVNPSTLRKRMRKLRILFGRSGGDGRSESSR
jgi:transcriptional regulator with GAF, ATPase, and Fis domain